jgi:alkylation response protein AidB-like acyl-CoA dehydrogenase
MAANAIDTVDRTALDALREGVASVLAEQSGSTALHAFIDGKRALDRELWQQAAVLGWLGVGIPEQYGGLDLGARGIAILHGELGRQATPGPYIATLAAAETIAACGDEAGRQRYLSRIAAGEISAAVPADLSRAAAHGTLRCLGAPDAALLVAQTAEGWALLERW